MTVLVDVDAVLPSKCNRPLNMQYVHNGLAQRSFGQDGYDPNRPQPGLLKRNKSADKIQAMIEHYMKAVQSAPEMHPPLHKSKACYESLAGSHITCTFRLYKNGCRSPITGKTYVIADDGIKFVCDEGFPYLVLDENLADGDAILLSEWRNSDQNQ